LVAVHWLKQILEPGELRARLIRSRLTAEVWREGWPIRQELFSDERLAEHAVSLAKAHKIRADVIRSRQLLDRLDDNDRALAQTYRATAIALELDRPIAPAAEWLIDNYYIVEKQIRKIRDDLPPDFYVQLPKLADGPLASLPRVFGIAWAYVAHSDSMFDETRLRRFLAAYQRVNALTIGELWALAISLQLVLVENMRRLADRAIADENERVRADAFADALFAAPTDADAFATMATIAGAQRAAFVSQLALRLRDVDSRSEIARRILGSQVTQQGSGIAELDAEAQTELIASTASIRNAIMAMRAVADVDWGETVEALSLSDKVLREHSNFGAMDFQSRNLYRNALEELARGSNYSEDAIAIRALALARDQPAANAVDKDPGFFLIGSSRPELESAIGYVPPLDSSMALRVREGGILLYILLVLLVATSLSSLPIATLSRVSLEPLYGLILLAAMVVLTIETATGIVNRLMANLVQPALIPALELPEGIPAHLRTLIVVPVLLGSEAATAEAIARLEVHHLASRDANIHYALLTDFTDSDTESRDGEDALLATARAQIAYLNARYTGGDAGPRFFFLHRRRQYNPSERCWMGWERKRGKLDELNRLLRGATDTSFINDGDAPLIIPADVRYVITLDADTKLPMGAARRMIGKMAHPLNRPRFDVDQRRVIAGYGIMQPRVSIDMPVGRGRSPFEVLASGPAGIDPYASATSDLYQDILGEGSFTGKGIYDVDAFMAALARRVPENTMLSHDLFEGTYARAGLISDVEVIEDFPIRYDVALRRQHRWVRGDWQLLPWILRVNRKSADHLPRNGRAKMLDNLRRSLVAPAIVTALIGGWFLPAAHIAGWTIAILILVAIPPLLPVPSLLVSKRKRDVALRAHWSAIGNDIRAAFGTILLQLVTLVDQAARMTDAIARTLIRLTLTRRHLLEWTTAAQDTAAPDPGTGALYRMMWQSVAFVAGMAALALYMKPASAPVALPLTLAWLLAPIVVHWANQPARIATSFILDAGQRAILGSIARETWAYFAQHVTPEHNHLPPDNFQEDPEPVVAGRTSPTNIGLYLLAAVTAAAHDWCTRAEAIARLEATFVTLRRLGRFRGHFYNWYDTRDMRVLDPPYVSSVDSGNLAGHLIALANLLENWTDPALAKRASQLARQARVFALAMDFSFLVDPDRMLMSIGWSTTENRRDEGCYDLLASEARLGSLFAIAKGDLPARHWKRLGRSATPVTGASVLISWSGSMFEYLMPSLLMRAPDSSLLEVSNRHAVDRQREYAKDAGVPWGISESAFNARDREMTYQYSNFGVPGLGLKRGLSENLVIAPYATGLATMVDAPAALANFAALEALGARGRFGFYEALDFTPGRVPEGSRFALVRTYMAHHQGMTLLAIANVLDGGQLRAAFHAEPMIRAAELLLHERPPRGVGTFNLRAEETTVAAINRAPEPGAVRSYSARTKPTPPVHLLSNGRYAVMLTSAGAGSSRWRSMAINRWREDPVIAGHGSWIYLADRHSGGHWSATLAPLGGDPEHYAASFVEGHAEFHRRDGAINTTTEILISPEDDAEVRRVSIANRGRETHRIDVTSCIELAMALPANDLAHPAFSRLFIETEMLDGNVLVAHRRPRAASDAPIWVAHLAVPEDDLAGAMTWETDRAAFIGRGRSTANPLGADQPLAGGLGTVVDPILSLRCPINVPPGRTMRVAFWTIAAASREELLQAIDRHRDVSAFDRARLGAWTQAQIERRFLGLDSGDAADYQRLAAHIVHGGGPYAPPRDLVAAAAAPQSGLWVHGISGDVPILLVSIEDPRDMELVGDLLRAFEFLRSRQLSFDLVVLNERGASYVQDLQQAIDELVRGVRARQPAGSGGNVFTLRADLMQPEQVDGLRALSRIEMRAQRGPLRRQLQRPPVPLLEATRQPAMRPPVPPRTGRPPDPTLPQSNDLEFWNGFGGFHADGREYAIILPDGVTTPAPWINVIANPQFGCHVSGDALGAIWAGNARENQLTPWSNDAVSDPAGDALYIRDLDSGHIWSPTTIPAGGGGRRIVRHGFGYSRFHAIYHGIETDLLVHVPVDAPLRLARLTLRNRSSEARTLSVTGYAEWVLGSARSKTAAHVVTEHDAQSGALFARNPFDADAGTRIAFADLGGCQTSWTCDRMAFLGSGGMARPAALIGNLPLTAAAGAGLDPCAALSTELTLSPGEACEIVWTIGQATDRDAARALVTQWRTADLDAELARTAAQWRETLGTVQVKSPDRAMDIMLNGWLQYQVLGCRIWGRAGFYQASGAYGFRDQLQDGGAMLLSRPDLVRPHLLRAAGRQFREGDVQHWWLPETGRGVRTRISDDRGWLALSVADYVDKTGDAAILDTAIPFLEGRHLDPGEHDAFYLPGVSVDTASLYEHCALALDQSVTLTGSLGIPLMGTGDWNDGMNRVGEDGSGMSVWLGWHLIHAINRFAPFADDREPDRAARWRAHADSVRNAIETHAWDGAWYRRATYDDGTWLGSRDSDECRIDSIAQTWAVLSSAADPLRSATALQSVNRYLVDRAAGLVKLFTPPFDKTAHDPGYIRGYPPGLRENGGQYSHAAMWTILAAAKQRDGDLAAELFGLLNPINHALNPADVARYRVEPYVVAADIYAVAPNYGRGGWTWYTGAAGWLYRAGIEGLYGLERRGDCLRLRPCLPSGWPTARMTLHLDDGQYEIVIARLTGMKSEASLDGMPIAVEDGMIEWRIKAGNHIVRYNQGV
jgi:cyclic beta-1,2-glucan synthetase